MTTLPNFRPTIRAATVNRSVRRGIAGCLLLTLIAFSGAGCRLTKPGSASFASVTIGNYSPQQIQDATAKVFRGDGYAAYIAGPGQMVFQKEGSRANNISQNGFVDSYYGATTMFRVRAEIVDLGTGSYRLQCQAYMVRNAGDSFFEDEHPLATVRRMPYQLLLNKVARELKSSASAG